MYVNGPSHVHGAQTLAAPHRAANVQPPRETSTLSEVDQLDFSAQALEASRARDTGEIRHDKVAALRAAIAEGNYDTPEKMDIAMSRLFDTLG